MAFKRTRKDQIDSGKKELPRKLAFLGEMKVDFLSFAHDEDTGETTVELTAAAVKALARKGADLKELKASQKDFTADDLEWFQGFRPLFESPLDSEAMRLLEHSRQFARFTDGELGGNPNAINYLAALDALNVPGADNE